MKTHPLYRRLHAWIEAHFPLRCVDTIVSDYTAWTPW